MSEQFLNSTSAHNRPFQCHDVLCALTLLVGWQEGHPACKKTERWGAGVVICLERGADCHCHSLSLASVKSRLVLPFWYRPTWVVPEKGPLNARARALR